jgi:hypothetical protein
MIRAVAALSFLLGLSASASAGYLHYPPAPPDCASPHILDRISERFQWAEGRTWQTYLRIAAFDSIRELGTGPQNHPSFLPHRHCQASAALTNGETQRIYYTITSATGLAGVGADVEFCIAKYDRWHVYGASCRSVRP